VFFIVLAYNITLIENLNNLSHKTTIALINKSDLPSAISSEDQQILIQFKETVFVSALHHTGIDILKNAIIRILLDDKQNSTGDAIITNIRHKSSLEAALASVQNVMSGLIKHISPELLCIDLHAALHALGEISGETTTDEILNSIFSSFCIGK